MKFVKIIFYFHQWSFWMSYYTYTMSRKQHDFATHCNKRRECLSATRALSRRVVELVSRARGEKLCGWTHVHGIQCYIMYISLFPIIFRQDPLHPLDPFPLCEGNFVWCTIERERERDFCIHTFSSYYKTNLYPWPASHLPTTNLSYSALLYICINGIPIYISTPLYTYSFYAICLHTFCSAHKTQAQFTRQAFAWRCITEHTILCDNSLFFFVSPSGFNFSACTLSDFLLLLLNYWWK